MQLLPCPSCNRSISRAAVSCPKCGQPLTEGWAEKIEARIKTGKKILLIIVGAIIAISFLSNIGSHSSSHDTASYAAYQESPAAPQATVLRSQDYGADWPFTVPEIELGCENRLRGSIIRPHVYAIAGGKKYGLNGAAMGNGAYYINGREITKKEDGVWMNSSDFIKRGLDLCGSS